MVKYIATFQDILLEPRCASYIVKEKIVKPSYEVKVGDIVEIEFGDKVSKFQILEIPTREGKDLGEIIKLL